MSTIVTRSVKGSPLTHNEVDANFSNLNTDKIQSGNTVAALTITSATINGGSISGITALPIASGGTGAATAAEAFSDLTPLTLTTASASALVLTNTSGYQQQIIGSTNQTITLPSTATLAVGWSFLITNGTGFTVTVQTSTGASVYSNSNIGSYRVWCISTANNNAASWSAGAETFSFETGTGSVVRASSPTIASATLTGPTATGALAFSGTTTQVAQFGTSVTTGNGTMFTALTSGTLSIGGATGTGIQIFGRSTLSQTTNIQAGATSSGYTKTINIGTGGLAGSTTAIAIGSTTGTSTTTLNGELNATGVATFSAGTAALPAITTTGDTNTGIFFPAADTIGLAAGGVESARIVSGLFSIPANSTAASAVRLYEDTDNGTNYVDIIAPAAVTSNRTLTLPDLTGTLAVYADPQVTVYTSSSGTYTVPTGARYLTVELVGGGAGGSASSNGAAGGAGGNTTFSTLTGTGGTSNTPTVGGLGGAASGGDVNIAGGSASGSYQAYTTSGASYTGGSNGGVSFFGGAGRGAAPGSSAGGAAATNSGSGGGGGSQNTTAYAGTGGGAGGYVRKLITSPSSTYSYAVGAGGSGGAAGVTDSFAGGAGGSGIIIVTAYFG